MKKTVRPMLARIGTLDDLKKADYIYEPKLDGIRALLFIKKNHIALINRNGVDITFKYPDLEVKKNIRATSAILDGEIVVYDEKGTTNFHYVMARDAVSNPSLIEERVQEFPATYVIFDLLELNGRSYIKKPWYERRKALEKIVRPKKNLVEITPYTYDSKKLWSFVKKQLLEGVMAKYDESLYYPGKRTASWLKIKPRQTVDCVIIGFSQENRLVSALALALYKNGVLTYIGKVGTGFDERMQEMLYKKFKTIKQDHPPCACPLQNMRWLKPKLVAEVRYQQRTRLGSLRIPVFVRLRTDKKPKDCTFRQ